MDVLVTNRSLPSLGRGGLDCPVVAVNRSSCGVISVYRNDCVSAHELATCTTLKHRAHCQQYHQETSTHPKKSC
jgi:hypothetical protein